ncbi:MAG: hypothetical protein OHK0021_16880 [Bryobacter sp.]
MSYSSLPTPYQAYRESESAYLEQRVFSSSPLELVCLLYEGAIDGVGSCRRFLQQGDILARGRSVARVQGILVELLNSLNGQVDADLARRLALLYDYMLRKLEEGHREQRPEPFEEVESLLKNLQEAWQDLVKAETSSITKQSSETDASPANCLA